MVGVSLEGTMVTRVSYLHQDSTGPCPTHTLALIMDICYITLSASAELSVYILPESFFNRCCYYLISLSFFSYEVEIFDSKYQASSYPVIMPHGIRLIDFIILNSSVHCSVLLFF